MSDSCQKTGLHSNPSYCLGERKLPLFLITGEQHNYPRGRALVPHTGEGGPDWPLALDLGRSQPGTRSSSTCWGLQAAQALGPVLTQASLLQQTLIA